jgi:hypothetical protein
MSGVRTVLMVAVVILAVTLGADTGGTVAGRVGYGAGWTLGNVVDELSWVASAVT